MMFLLTGTLVCVADEPQNTTPQKFSPEKFQAEMEQFITKEAGLTADEAAKFFPIYREMQQKQRAVFAKMREEGRVKPTDDASCKKLVQKRDEVELELAREPHPGLAEAYLPNLKLRRHRQHAPGGPSLGQGDGALDGHLLLQMHVQRIHVETDLFHIHGYDLP